MEMTPTPQSSNVASVGYDPETQQLRVEYKSGGVYNYEGVPPNYHQELLEAESVGKFLTSHVKTNFTCTRHDG